MSGDQATYLHFHYLSFVLPQSHYSLYRESENIVARICLPQMQWQGRDEKVEAYAGAVAGVMEMETNPRRQEKYIEYVEQYARLDEAERALFGERYPREGKQVETVISRARSEGVQEGHKEGRQEERSSMLLHFLERRFGEKAKESYRERIEGATMSELEVWLDRFLDAERIEDVFLDH
ncbi:DUF4351 domain-containing protein [Halorhodospira abdelmalekii]|uniref:DUF4351 domain-containing protein n=1 Tax=Halorhodospira abdelmalekii TaxID=421629 RepID=UPI001A91BC2B|nr:DUF4351 domain-containing protein [Halorhodospira abdelmalekii]